jgi:hypothetical protein
MITNIIITRVKQIIFIFIIKIMFEDFFIIHIIIKILIRIYFSVLKSINLANSFKIIKIIIFLLFF